MAPNGKQTTFEIRQLVIKLHSEGKKVREIGDIVGRSSSTVHDIIKRHRDEFRINNKSREGQGKILNDRDERRIIQKIKKNPFETANELKTFVKTSTGKDVCANTIRNVLKRHDYHGRIARQKPFISPKNKKFRLKFAKEYLLKTEEFWKTVISIWVDL